MKWSVLVAAALLVGCGGSSQETATGTSSSGSSSGSGGSGGGPAAAYDIAALDGVRIGSNPDDKASYQHADAEVELTGGPFASVMRLGQSRDDLLPVRRLEERSPARRAELAGRLRRVRPQLRALASTIRPISRPIRPASS